MLIRLSLTQVSSVYFVARCCNFWDNSFRCYALEQNSARLLQTINSHTDAVTCLSLSPDNSLLVTGSLDTTVMVWATQPKSAKVCTLGLYDVCVAMF